MIPCMTFVATFSEFQTLLSESQLIIIFQASGVSFVRLQHLTGVDTSVFATAITKWTVAFLLCSFVTTVYSTGNLTILSTWMNAN